MRCHILLALGLVSASTAWAARGDERAGPSAFTAQIEALGLSRAQVVDPFEVTAEMEAFADEVTQFAPSPLDKLEALQRALVDPGFGFVYDREATLTAAEAFAARRGNCLAFTAMFVGLARSVGVDAFLASIREPGDATREDDLIVLMRHVVAGYAFVGTMYLFDFARESSTSDAGWVPVDDLVAAGMFHANRGAWALREGRATDAEAELAVAAALSPTRPSTWVNLGVARRRIGDLDGAVDAYGRALAIDPHDGGAWTNLAVVYDLSGRPDEAMAALRAGAREPSSAWHLVALADLERAAGRSDEARRMLVRARHHDPGCVEVHEALARWAADEGFEARARRSARRAARAAEALAQD